LRTFCRFSSLSQAASGAWVNALIRSAFVAFLLVALAIAARGETFFDAFPDFFLVVMVTSSCGATQNCTSS
jgi:hypothetical protein